ncbi:hypothetical protein ACFSQ7_36510 [Paenibacillus rhizoplanae]
MNFIKGGDTGNYFADIPFYMLTLLGGMMDTDNPDNPFSRLECGLPPLFNR